MEKLRDESLKKGREEGENLMARLMALLLEKGLVKNAAGIPKLKRR
jgi:hypothetical protein